MDGLHRMNYDAMLPWGGRAAAAARRLDDRALLAAALAADARGTAVPGATEEGEARRAEAAALIDAMPDAELAQRLDALTHLAGTELYLHRFDDASAHAQRALTIGRATGQDQQFPLVFAILGITWFLRGELAESVEPLDAAVEAARLTGNAQALAWSRYPLSKIALAQGDVALAITSAQEAVDATEDARANHHFSHAAFALAEASLETGKPERAVELLERSSGGADQSLVAKSFRALWLELLTRARLALRHAAEAAPRRRRCPRERRHRRAATGGRLGRPRARRRRARCRRRRARCRTRALRRRGRRRCRRAARGRDRPRARRARARRRRRSRGRP